MHAVDFVYPLVKRQRCWAHKLRNVANYLRKKDLRECINGARRIYSASSKADTPREMRVKLRTTNAIERSFREVRRRTRPSGGEVTVELL